MTGQHTVVLVGVTFWSQATIMTMQRFLLIRYLALSLLTAALTGITAVAGDGVDWTAARAAAKELSNRITFLQQAFATIGGPPEGRGLYQQADVVLMNLGRLQNLLQQKAPRGELYLALGTVDQPLTQLLGDIQNFEKWDPTLRYAARRTQAAQQDLHVALHLGDGNAPTQSEVLQRQTLILRGRLDNLQGLVRYVFYEQASLPAWNRALAGVMSAVNGLQERERSKAAKSELKEQLAKVNQAWSEVVTLIQNLPAQQNILLRSDAAQVDAAFHRLSQSLGLKLSRPLLIDPLAF